MSTLYYDFTLTDGTIKTLLKNQSVSFEERKQTSINVADADGAITIPITEIGTVIALLVESEGEITLTVNGQAISVSSFFFVTLSALTSLTVACSDATGKLVTVTVWGS